MPPETRLVTPPNTLKAKVGNGGFDAKALDRAEKAIENNNVDFRPHARDMIKELSGLIDQVKNGDRPLDAALRDIMFPITQLNSHGAMFRYGSISQISVSLIDFLEAVTVHDTRLLKIIECYRDAAGALIAQNISKADHPACIALTRAFEDTCDKYKKTIEKIS